MNDAEIEILREGVRASEEILRSAFGIEVRKALDPLKLHDFEHIVQTLAHSLKGHAIPAEDAAVKKALGKVDAKWTDMNAEARAKVIDEAAHYLGPPVVAQVLPKVEQTLKFAAKDIVPGTKKSAVLTYDLGISPNMSATDDRVLGFAVASQGHFIRNKYGDRMHDFGMRARGIVANGLVKGLGSADIADDLHRELSTHVGRGKSYWDIIAMVFTNRARTMTQLAAYDDAGIEDYRWESVLDEATSVQCRFLHGKKFPVAQAMKRFQQVEDASSPEAIKTIQPFLQYGKRGDGTPALYYNHESGGRAFVAHVEENAIGQKDQVGAFSNTHSEEKLAAAGISTPPIHGSCRSTIIPEFGGGGGGGAPVPAEPSPVPTKLPPGAQKAQALAQLDDVNEGGEVEASKFFAKHTDEQPWEQHGAWHLFDEGAGTPWETNKVSKKPAIDDLIATTPSFDADATEKYLKKPKALDNAPKPKVIKWKDKLYLLQGHEQIAAQKLMGQKQAYVELVDLDKKLKPAPTILPTEPTPPVFGPPIVPTPHEEPPPLAPLAPALAHDKPGPSADIILGEKTAGPAGSNEGGFYTGKDGIKRYVKFYKQPSQAYGENLANAIYADLGHPAPDSSVFEHDGKIAYASEIIGGTKTLKDAGLTEARAKQALRGYVADVLVGNWDAVGMNLDNMVVNPAGQVIRVDNGGSFLFRAKEGRKPSELLNKITEWDGFFDSSKNPAYAKLAAAAGVSSARDMKDIVIPEIKKVLALRDAHGGWSGYVEKIAGGMSLADKENVIEMLDHRSNLLQAKIAELNRPGPADASQPIIGHLPKKSLPEPSRTHVGHKSESEYVAAHKDRLRGVDEAGKDAVVAFTDGEYTAIRDFEIHGIAERSAVKRSKDIEKFFETTKPTPGVVYRGIGPSSKKPGGIHDDEMRAFLEQDEFVLGGTTSTTRNPSTAYSFGKIGAGYESAKTKNRVLLVLNQKSAVGVESISEVHSELELLMPKEAKFRITGRYQAAGEKNVLIIEAEEIAGAPKKKK